MHNEHPLRESVDDVIRDHVPEGSHHAYILRVALTQLVVQLFPHGRSICPKVLEDRQLLLLKIGVQSGKGRPRPHEGGTDQLDRGELPGFVQLRQDSK